MFRFFLFCTCVWAVTTSVTATPFRDCGSTGTIRELRVPGCNTLPCVLIRGETTNIQIDFTANSPAQSIETDLSGVFLGIQAPWPGAFPPGCDMLLSGNCPLTAGESVTYSADLAIEASWPSVTATATWKIVDGDTGAAVVCLQVPLNLV